MPLGIGVDGFGPYATNIGALGIGVDGFGPYATNIGALGIGVDYETEAAIRLEGVDYEGAGAGVRRPFTASDLMVDTSGADIVARSGPFAEKIVLLGPDFYLGRYRRIEADEVLWDKDAGDLTVVDGRTNKMVLEGTDLGTGERRRVTPDDAIVDVDGTDLI